MIDVQPWTIGGSEALPLLGDSHLPQRPTSCVVMLHGYMGYKDYGFIPVLADHLAKCGSVVHRFNFAHSGMTNAIETFVRVDLFERQTWNAQVYDTLCVIAAVRDGTLGGAGLPLFLLGHSRGGVAALLTAGRHPNLGLAGVITLAAPAACSGLSGDQRLAWLKQGHATATSSRTGQTMRISSRWLEEQIADPEGHDPLHQASRVGVPLLCVHGAADETVPLSNAHAIASAAGENARLVEIRAGNHVFAMPNPPVPARIPTTAFCSLADAVAGFVSQYADNSV